MIPPAKINVLDQHNGFTAVTNPRRGTTLWRPGVVLRGKPPIGALIRFDASSFYQNSPPGSVTKAVYKVKGYKYLVVLWFDNITGRRLA